MTSFFRLFTALPVMVGLALATTAVPLATSTEAQASAGFRKWVRDFKGVARRNGIKGSTYDRAFAGIRSADPDVLESARYQPEFRQRLWMYFDTRIDENTIARGQEEKRRWNKWLARIERKYGVSANILLAIWSMESGYGEALKKERAMRPIVRSLATLAYADRRRRKFGRSQLIAALKIVQNGDVSIKGLTGSWAGAMGHTQFIPTSYQLYRQDIDGNGRADIWTSVPDALATAANLLKRNGWQTGKTWGYEVDVPARIRKQAGKTRTMSQWAKLGIRRVKGRKFPRGGERGVLKFPAGKNGPAFLLTRNFFIIKRYNNSDKYALAVGHLADRIAGYGDFVNPVPRPTPKLSFDQKVELQQRLTRMGLYDSKIDGKIGSGTRAAIRKAQIKLGLNPTGFESPSLLTRLRKVS